MASNRDLDLIFDFRKLSLNSRPRPRRRRSLFASVKVKKDNTIVSDILNSLSTKNIDDYLKVLKKGVPYQLKSLDERTFKYTNINTSFTQTLNAQRDRWTVVDIKKVLCPYLLSAFLLMEQKKKKNGARVKKISLYHGTRSANIPSICTRNFDWRLQGTSRGHKFGQGISFARRSTYACHYPSLCVDSRRTLILAETMMGRYTRGSAHVTVPQEGYDTTTSPTLDVVVKYDDAEYYPEFIIYYSNNA